MPSVSASSLVWGGQALDLGAGKPIAYFPHDESVLVDKDNQITHREDARPQYREEAA